MSSRNLQDEFLTEAEFRAWHGCLRFSNNAMFALDQALRAAHEISLSEFDVLITLFNAPNDRLRMTELSKQVLLTASGMTQLVTRLDSRGLVSRSVDEADRRSFFATLTKAGHRRLREARPTHNEIVRSLLTRRLSAEQLAAMGDLWVRWKPRAGSDARTGAAPLCGAQGSGAAPSDLFSRAAPRGFTPPSILGAKRWIRSASFSTRRNSPPARRATSPCISTACRRRSGASSR